MLDFIIGFLIFQLFFYFFNNVFIFTSGYLNLYQYYHMYSIRASSLLAFWLLSATLFK